MKITLLGTGTPAPSLKRMSSGYMVEVGDDLILFDHGPGAYHRMMEAGKRAVDVTHVFFSHLHYDHCLDYMRLLMTHWDQGAGEIPELKVYGPPHMKRMTQAIIGKNGVFGPDLEARTKHQVSIDVYQSRGGIGERKKPKPEVTEIRSGQVIKGNGWKVRVTSVPHVQPYLISYGFRLDCDAGSFVYSGDCGPCNAMKKLAKGADVMVYMTHYLSGTEPSKTFAKGVAGHMEVAEVGQAAGVKNLVVSHVLKQMDEPGLREKVLRDMGKVYKGNLFFGEDLMEIPLEAPMATDRER
ncbi:MAG: MBL fold metallo-hydrolase [Alphaproteobacteria bacterium]|nr:MBL fold metallo-hydrolase [Alphaproteobacteria bacterium]|tara:strand:- start:170 stop:1057 length:888 start_codon:yes stop_codon:yes gene_type:complete